MMDSTGGWQAPLGNVVYIACALTSLACAILLVRAYIRSRSQLLFWSSICFIGLFANNVLLVVDEVLTSREVSFLLARDLTNLAASLALVIGLVWTARGGS